MRTVHIVLALVFTPLLAYVIAISTQQERAPQPAKPQEEAAQSAKPLTQTPQRAPAQPVMPSDKKLLMQIRSTLIALDQANLTGNYTVFRDLGAPGFQQANTPAQLSEIFGRLRERKLDLSPIVLIPAKLSRKPATNAKGQLRVTGFFPTRPERVDFDLIFELMDGELRLLGISVGTSLARPLAAVPTKPESTEAQPKPEAGVQTAKPVPPPAKPQSPADPAKAPEP